ncbi:MAG: RagB/SusD family nutrient uptake outer membrane protein [Rikenellaceae bacterium]
MKLQYKIAYFLATTAIIFSLSSCTDYLDKSADSTVDSTEAFKSFTNLQGYMEQNYHCIPNKTQIAWDTTQNWGEDEIMNSFASGSATSQFDLGNMWACRGYQSWLDNENSSIDVTSKNPMKFAFWDCAWYCIRVCNMTLENIDLMTDATDEERDIIMGQAYFFRAWWHFEIMKFFGGLPYIDRVLPSNEPLTEPRLSFQEAAMKAATDFRLAADLLPIDWDKTDVGLTTLGQNDLRITKITALGYLGKCYLWAASPLMEHGAQLGAIASGRTYDYNQEYAAEAAEALGECIDLLENNADAKARYFLLKFDYSDIYNHIPTDNSSNFYTENVYNTGKSFALPGYNEAVMRGTIFVKNRSHYRYSTSFGCKINSLYSGTTDLHLPTANYVNHAYGMQNGLPLDDPDSGFDPEYPFKNRDPRFYHDIAFDGFQVINASTSDADAYLKYATLSTGGAMRDVEYGSRTGYFTVKTAGHKTNKYDNANAWSVGMQINISHMRLAEIYLLYAEAGAALDNGGRDYKSSNCSMTSADALNKIRARVGVDPVNTKFTGNDYMDEIRRERAAELAFEGYRFNDLQRWLLLTEAPYNIKTSQEFNRKEADSFFDGTNQAEARVSGWREETILTREFSIKHYWFPLRTKDVSLYEGFDQNYGW